MSNTSFLKIHFNIGYHFNLLQYLKFFGKSACLHTLLIHYDFDLWMFSSIPVVYWTLHLTEKMHFWIRLKFKTKFLKFHFFIRNALHFRLIYPRKHMCEGIDEGPAGLPSRFFRTKVLIRPKRFGWLNNH